MHPGVLRRSLSRRRTWAKAITMECARETGADRPDEYPRVVDKVAMSQTAGFLGESEGPLEAVSRHPRRGLSEPARQAVQLRSNSNQHGAVQSSRVALHPDLLLRGPQGDEDDRWPFGGELLHALHVGR